MFVKENIAACIATAAVMLLRCTVYTSPIRWRRKLS